MSNPNVIYRRNKLFCIDKTQLPDSSKKEAIYNALYAAVYSEFMGANENKDYKDLNSTQKLVKVNEFAFNWLNERGLI